MKGIKMTCIYYHHGKRKQKTMRFEDPPYIGAKTRGVNFEAMREAIEQTLLYPYHITWFYHEEY